MPAAGTELQRRFATAYANNGGSATKAAIEAGYSEHSAKDIGRITAALPHVQTMIVRELMKMQARSGAVGLGALINVAENEKAAAAARVAAARTLLEHARMIGPGRANDDDEGEDQGGEVVDYNAALERLGLNRRSA